MSTKNVPHPGENFEVLAAMLRDTPDPADSLAGSALDPTKGARGLTAVHEALPVALRRIGLLIAALSAGETLHPCLTEENLRQTVADELADVEAILERIQEAAGAPPRAAA